MFKDGQVVCDACNKPITRVTEAPAEGWPDLHSLCSACFDQLKGTSLPR